MDKGLSLWCIDQSVSPTDVILSLYVGTTPHDLAWALVTDGVDVNSGQHSKSSSCIPGTCNDVMHDNNKNMVYPHT